MDIAGYKRVNYTEFQSKLKKIYETSNKTLPELAVFAELSSTMGIRNALEPDEQKVSDKVLTSVCHALNFNAFVAWLNGERYYYIGKN